MVTPSMRRQTITRKNRENFEAATRAKRHQAVTLLAENKSYRAIARATGLAMGTIGRLKQGLQEANDNNLPYDDSEYELKRGPKPVLAYGEERAIVRRLKECAERGFAQSNEALKSIAAEIASDGRRSFPNGYPSDDWARSFRSRHRDVTFRKMESREGAKVAAANPDHVQTLVHALRLCEKQNPGILGDPRCLWNMDETQVSINVTETEKGYVSAHTNHGGQKIRCDSQGRHLTAVVIASAAGDVLPPFFIFAGSNNMERWYNPLPPVAFKDDAGVPHWLTRTNWFPDDAFVTCSVNGSMTQELIPFVIDHIEKHAPQYTGGRQMLLLVDGHKSRNGHLWLTKAKQANVEVIQSPANTSHFLQACDQCINKKYKSAMRTTFQILSKQCFLDFGDMSTKLKLGIAGYRSLTGEVVSKAFEAVGLWPMNFRFLQWAEEKWTGVRDPETDAERRSLRIEVQNQWKEMMKVFHGRGDITFKIDKLENIILSGQSRVKFILERRTPTKRKVWKNPPDFYDRSTLARGTPAVYLTHGELIRKRKDIQETESRERDRKIKEKEESSARKLKEAQVRAQKKAELIAQKHKNAEQKLRRKKEQADEKARRKAAAAAKRVRETNGKSKSIVEMNVRRSISKRTLKKNNVLALSKTNVNVDVSPGGGYAACFTRTKATPGGSRENKDDETRESGNGAMCNGIKVTGSSAENDVVSAQREKENDHDAVSSLLQLHAHQLRSEEGS